MLQGVLVPESRTLLLEDGGWGWWVGRGRVMVQNGGSEGCVAGKGGDEGLGSEGSQGCHGCGWRRGGEVRSLDEDDGG